MFTKKLITLILASIILAFSCKKTGPVIGFILPHMTIKRYPIERDVLTQKVHELGGEVIFMSADNDEIKQFEQVKEILNKNIDVLVLDPVNRFKAAGMVRAAHQKGIKVISYDRLIANCDVDYLMTFDASAIGKQMSEYVTNKIPNGKYYILGGDKTDMNAIMIDDAVTKSLAPSVTSGKINILCKMFIEKYGTNIKKLDNSLFDYYELSNGLEIATNKQKQIIRISTSSSQMNTIFKTSKGINLDSSVNDVIKAYGENYYKRMDDSGVSVIGYVDKNRNVTLEFYNYKNKVTMIRYDISSMQ